MTKSFPLENFLLSDRYRILQQTGYDGFCTTYLAQDQLLQIPVTVKEYLPREFADRLPQSTVISPSADEEFAAQYKKGLDRFISEADKLTQFRSVSGIVDIIDCIQANGTAYMITEHLEGRLLKDLLQEKPILSEKEVKSMLEPVLTSLQMVHEEGIIHRQICPDNIFLCSDGNVKLIDFGASRDAAVSYTRSLTVSIKTGYSPEEQYRGLSEQGPCTDVYSLAATMYRMLTGHVVPDALERRASIEKRQKDPLVPPRKLNPKISAVTEAALLHALKIRPEDRTASIKEFRRALSGRHPSSKGKNRISSTRRRVVPVWIVGLALLGFVLFGAGILALRQGFFQFDNNQPLLARNGIVVPNVEGLTRDEARQVIRDAGLVPLVLDTVSSDFIEEGRIVLQSPQPGRILSDSDNKVYLTLSKGVSPKIPYIVSMDKQTAIDTLIEAGITDEELSGVDFAYEYNDTKPVGTVLKQNVVDRMPRTYEIVTLTLSAGPSLGILDDILRYRVFFDSSADAEEPAGESPGFERGSAVHFLLRQAGDENLPQEQGSLPQQLLPSLELYLVSYTSGIIHKIPCTGPDFTVSSEALEPDTYFFLLKQDGRLVSFFQAPFALDPSSEEVYTCPVDIFPDGLLIPNGSTREIADSVLSFASKYIPYQSIQTGAVPSMEPLDEAALANIPIMHTYEQNSFSYKVLTTPLRIYYDEPELRSSTETSRLGVLPDHTGLKMLLVNYATGELVDIGYNGSAEFKNLSPGYYYIVPEFEASISQIFAYLEHPTDDLIPQDIEWNQLDYLVPLIRIVESSHSGSYDQTKLFYRLVLPADAYSPQFYIQFTGEIDKTAYFDGDIPVTFIFYSDKANAGFHLDEEGFLCLTSGSLRRARFSVSKYCQLVLTFLPFTGNDFDVPTGEEYGQVVMIP